MTRSTTAARNLLISLGLVICLSITAEAAVGIMDILPNLLQTTKKPTVAATYLGCYADDDTRDLKDQIGLTSNTIENCVLYCWKKNYKYMGLQYR